MRGKIHVITYEILLKKYVVKKIAEKNFDNVWFTIFNYKLGLNYKYYIS